MYELNEQELASVVGGGDVNAKVYAKFDDSFNNNKVSFKNIKIKVNKSEDVYVDFPVLNTSISASASYSKK
jgi:bacteriocin-like protein